MVIRSRFDKARRIADEEELEVAVLARVSANFPTFTDDLLLHITAPQRRCELF